MGAKNSYGAIGRGDTLSFNPETLKVITDPKHPLYDARVEREPDEALILSIMRNGIIVPLVISRDGDEVYVTDGRQRRAAAVEANKRLKKEGGQPVVCPCVWRRGDEKKLYEIQVTTNALRTGDSPLESARKMQHLLELNGGDMDVTALAFGVGVATVKNHLALLECAPAVQKWVVAGGSATIATKMAKLSREEQVATLEKMVETGATKGKKAERAVKKKGASDDSPKPLSAKLRDTVRDALLAVPMAEKDEDISLATAVFAFLAGDTTAVFKRWPRVEALVVEALMPKVKEKKVKEPKAKKPRKSKKAEDEAQAAA